MKYNKIVSNKSIVPNLNGTKNTTSIVQNPVVNPQNDKLY